MICPNCGTNYPDGGSFCPNCGTAAPQANAGAAPQPNNMGAAPQYSAPQYTGTPVPPMGGGIEKRNIALCIILSLVTCGIYNLYWLYTLTEDVKKVSNNPNGTSGGMVILLSIVTCSIYLWYWMYKQGEGIDQAKASRGLPSGNSGILYLILALVGLSIVSNALMQNELNNLA